MELGEIAPQVQGFVTQNLDERCQHADQALAIAELFLRGLFAPDSLPSAPDGIQQVVHRNVLERNKRHGQGPFILLVCKGSVDTIRTDELNELEGMLIGFDAVNKDAIRAQFEDVVRSTLISIALNFSTVVSFQSVLDQVVAYRADSRPVFSYTPRMGSARAHVNHLADTDKFQIVTRQVATGARRKDVARAQELLLKSLLVDDDRLRAFLAAWTGLEILVNKLFPHYEASLFEDLGRGRAESLLQYFKQIQQAMPSRYRLRDKFTVISATLDPSGAATDLALFESAKKLRDSLSHGDELSDEALPLEDVSMLLRKYLALHLSAEAA